MQQHGIVNWPIAWLQLSLSPSVLSIIVNNNNKKKIAQANDISRGTWWPCETIIWHIINKLNMTSW